MRRVPSRQGMHLPQLSVWMKSMKNLARSTMQVASSITTRPPEPIMRADGLERLVVDVISRFGSGMQPPDGPPICTALNFSAGNAPADIEDDLPDGGAHGDFHKARAPRPCRRARIPWCPCSSPCRTAANPSAPSPGSLGTLARVSTLLMTVGLPKSPRSPGRAVGAAACPAVPRYCA